MGRVIVVGSINQDITVTVERFAEPGETLSGSGVAYTLGGKGANQAAAAAHSGARTLFIGRVGADPAGRGLRDELASHGVDTTWLLEDPTPSGTALITVEAPTGQNTIILDAGANGRVGAEQAREAVDLGRDDVVVLQGEIPPAANAALIPWAHRAGARVVLNLAPVYAIDPDALASVDVLVVNESEAGLVLGRPAPSSSAEAVRAAEDLRALGIPEVLVTLGGAGAAYASRTGSAHLDAVGDGPVVDTTGAGDATVGCLAAALAAGHSFEDSVGWGMRAGGAAVGAKGAAPSYAGIEPIA